MTITVNESTPRPLIEEPFVITIDGNKKILSLTSLQSFAIEDIATEYCARFYGIGQYEITIEGEYLWQI